MKLYLVPQISYLIFLQLAQVLTQDEELQDSTETTRNRVLISSLLQSVNYQIFYLTKQPANTPVPTYTVRIGLVLHGLIQTRR